MQQIAVYQLWHRALGIANHASPGQKDAIRARAYARNQGSKPTRGIGATLEAAAATERLTLAEQMAVVTLRKVGESVRQQQAEHCQTCLAAEEFFQRSEASFEAHPHTRTPDALRAVAEKDNALNNRPHTLACELLRCYLEHGIRVALVGPLHRRQSSLIVMGADPLDLDPAAVTRALDREMSAQVEDIHEVLGVPLA